MAAEFNREPKLIDRIKAKVLQVPLNEVFVARESHYNPHQRMPWWPELVLGALKLRVGSNSDQIERAVENVSERIIGLVENDSLKNNMRSRALSEALNYWRQLILTEAERYLPPHALLRQRFFEREEILRSEKESLS